MTHFNVSFMLQNCFFSVQEKVPKWVGSLGELKFVPFPNWTRFACREIFSESSKIKPNSDCKYPFPTDLAPNGSPFGAKSVRKG